MDPDPVAEVCSFILAIFLALAVLLAANGFYQEQPPINNTER